MQKKESRKERKKEENKIKKETHMKIHQHIAVETNEAQVQGQFALLLNQNVQA